MRLLMEEMRGELKAIHELVADVPKMSRKLDAIEQDITALKGDMAVVKAGVSAINQDITLLDQRVIRLEAA